MARLLRKVIDPVVGLAAESIAHHKNRSPSPQPGSHADHQFEGFAENPSQTEPAATRESDEEDWELDEASAELGPNASSSSDQAPPPGSCVPKGSKGGPASVDEIAKAFLSTYPCRPTGLQLPCPVILPQKRPGEKSRGFVHAYAPVLADVGVGERAWMDFLTCFEEAIRVSPAFDAVNAAVNVAGLVSNAVPSPIFTAVVTAITVADVAAKRVYERSRTNDFLRQVNGSFFQPLGLYCLLMFHDPQSNSAAQTFDLSAKLAKSSPWGEQPPPSGGIQAFWKNLKGVQGSTRGEMQMPQAAELVFPAVDRAQDAGGEPLGKWKRSTNYVTDYMDRRSQAKYAADNPDSSLAMKPEFESNMGGLGAASKTPQQARQRRIAMLGGGRGQGLRDKYGPITLLVGKASGGRLTGKDARPVSVIRRVLKPGVMYLMVTRMPSPQEIAAAREGLEVVEAGVIER